MMNPWRVTLAAGMMLCAVAVSAHTQTVQEVRMIADAEQEEYRFEPARITAKPGDVLLFRAIRGAPHSIVFEAAGLSPRAKAALNEALPRRAGDLSSPLLAENGAEYRIALPANLPAGTYRFFCLPHRAYDMRGELVVR